MGFYYKEAEILPPLPGEAHTLIIIFFPSQFSSFSQAGVETPEFSPQDSDSRIPIPKMCAVFTVGYHHFILGRGDGNAFDNLNVQKVPKFDPAAEVSKQMIQNGFFCLLPSNYKYLCTWLYC